MLKLCKIHACPNGTLGLHLSRAPWDPYPWVSGVQDGSNAYQAGVRSGDTILELNGCDVLGQTISELAAKIQNHWERGGSFVTVLIWRNKTENNAINQQSLQKFAKCLQHIAQLLECPVCLEVVKPPGWQCCNGHVLCNSCRGRTVKCPICRVTLGPRGRCLLSDKLFTLLAESFPCDGVRNGKSSSDCPKDFNDCHETPLINGKIDSPTSASSSPTLDKVHQRKHIAGNTILEPLKKPDDDNNQVNADGSRSTDNDNIVVLKLNLKSKKKNDVVEHGSCRHHHHHHHHHQQQAHHHEHQSSYHSHHNRTGLGQQQRTFHCPTGKSSCSLLHNATAVIASNNSRPDPEAKTLDCIWTQDVSHKAKGEEKIETFGKFITEWDVLSHLTQVHQISVAQHYTTFGQAIRLQFVNTKSMPCITIQSERTWNQNKENFKNNVNVSVGGVLVPTEKVQGHTFERRYKNSRTTSTSKNVHRSGTELFFVACIPVDQEEEELRNEMNDMNADTAGDTPSPTPPSLKLEFDDCRAVFAATADTAEASPGFVGIPNGPCTGAIKTAMESKSTRKSTTGHLIQDPGSEFSSTTLQSRFNGEHSPTSSRSICTNCPKADACTWCSSSSSSSSSSSASSSLSRCSSLASFSMSSSSSHRCCSNTTTRQHAIFIWYFGSECDVKNFRTVIECKRTGLKWTGCVHPLTESWSSIRQRQREHGRGLQQSGEQRQMEQFLLLDSVPDGGDNFFDIVIKIK